MESGAIPAGLVVSVGTGDNMAAALGLDARIGDVIMSVGTSGVVSVISATPTADASGQVAGFADATGQFLLWCAHSTRDKCWMRFASCSGLISQTSTHLQRPRCRLMTR